MRVNKLPSSKELLQCLTAFLVNKTNRCSEFQFYWYYYSTCFGQPFCPSSGVLNCTSALVHFMQLWPFTARSSIHPTPGSKWSQLHKIYQSRYTIKNSWWWAERLPETCRVVKPMKMEFSASVDFIHKESVTMHGHTIFFKKKSLIAFSTAWLCMSFFNFPNCAWVLYLPEESDRAWYMTL